MKPCQSPEVRCLISVRDCHRYRCQGGTKIPRVVTRGPGDRPVEIEPRKPRAMLTEYGWMEVGGNGQGILS